LLRLQAEGIPDRPEEVLKRATAAFEDAQKRSQLSRSHVRHLAASKGSWAWFNDFQGDLTNDMYPVLKGKTFVHDRGQLFSVFHDVEPGHVRPGPGDVSRVYSPADLDKDKEILWLVYVGEQSFPDQRKKKERFSFFIFPYRYGLEFNTVPP